MASKAEGRAVEHEETAIEAIPEHNGSEQETVASTPANGEAYAETPRTPADDADDLAGVTDELRRVTIDPSQASYQYREGDSVSTGYHAAGGSIATDAQYGPGGYFDTYSNSGSDSYSANQNYTADMPQYPPVSGMGFWPQNSASSRGRGQLLQGYGLSSPPRRNHGGGRRQSYSHSQNSHRGYHQSFDYPVRQNPYAVGSNNAYRYTHSHAGLPSISQSQSTGQSGFFPYASEEEAHGEMVSLLEGDYLQETSTGRGPYGPATYFQQPRPSQTSTLSHEADTILHPFYDLHASSEFVAGKVLKIIWFEPRGNSTKGTTIVSGGKGNVFRENRRFIIVESYAGHSVCLPIVTYGGQSCTKHGVHPRHHGIVYTDGPARRRPDEPRLGYSPIKMIPVTPTEGLSAASRVNYAKTYTVEHNTYINFIGNIAPEHFDNLLGNFEDARRVYKIPVVRPPY